MPNRKNLIEVSLLSLVSHGALLFVVICLKKSRNDKFGSIKMWFEHAGWILQNISPIFFKLHQYWMWYSILGHRSNSKASTDWSPPEVENYHVMQQNQQEVDEMIQLRTGVDGHVPGRLIRRQFPTTKLSIRMAQQNCDTLCFFANHPGQFFLNLVWYNALLKIRIV